MCGHMLRGYSVLNSICIIPARGGSKRIPRKNIKPFLGKPIISYSIKAASESGIFDEVMVSTDDEEIASVARAHGASVPFMRSAASANDYATTADVISEVLDRYGDQGCNYGVVCCLYATAPFVTAQKLQEANSLLDPDSCDEVLAVTEFSFPPMRAFVEEDGILHYRFPQYAKTRSQDLEPMYQDAGQFYFYGAGAHLNGRIDPAQRIGYRIPQTEVQDIDNQIDWDLAEMKYRMVFGDKTRSIFHETI